MNIFAKLRMYAVKSRSLRDLPELDERTPDQSQFSRSHIRIAAMAPFPRG